MNLKKTSEQIPFLALHIGGIFHAHGDFWIRTDYDAGTTIGIGKHGIERDTRLAHSCNFLIDGTVVHDGVGCELVNVVEVTDQ